MEALRDRFRGCVVGAAVGDALGMPAEGLSASEIRRRWGVLSDFRGAGGLGPGSWTDDTQLSLAVAESIADRGGLDPGDLAGRIARWRDHAVGPGRACLEAASRLAAGVSRGRWSRR